MNKRSFKYAWGASPPLGHLPGLQAYSLHCCSNMTRLRSSPPLRSAWSCAAIMRSPCTDVCLVHAFLPVALAYAVRYRAATPLTPAVMSLRSAGQAEGGAGARHHHRYRVVEVRDAQVLLHGHRCPGSP